MKERTLTGALLFLTIVFALLVRTFSIYIFDAIVLALMVGASLESHKLFASMGLYNNKKVVASFPILLYATFLALVLTKTAFVFSVVYLLLLIVFIGILTFLLGVLFKSKTENEIKTRSLKLSTTAFSLKKATHTIIAAIYPSLGLLAIVALNHLHQIKLVELTAPENMSLIALLFMFAITSVTDIFSMLVGKAFGKTRLAPRISPNKTVAGFVGGIVFAVLFAVATFVILGAFESFNSIFYKLNITYIKVILLGLFAALACNGGDLLESFLKRKAGVKDSGTILPGHGGLLDRFDSHTISAFVVLLFFVLII